MPPTIFIVPDLWEGPAVWEKLISTLKETYHLPVITTKLISTGQLLQVHRV